MFPVVSFILKLLDGIGIERREGMSERDDLGFKSDSITGKVSRTSFLYFCSSPKLNGFELKALYWGLAISWQERSTI